MRKTLAACSKILLRKTSLLDYPGCISAVFFFTGCNLRCPWCHNPELVLGGAPNLVSIDEGLDHLKKRRSVLGGVVLSGGEPCLYSDLLELVMEIKKMSLLVKLDTNGMIPAMLEKLFSRKDTLPDYIALDLKLSPSRYSELLPAATTGNTDTFNPAEALIKSAELIRESGINHEFRSLLLPSALRPLVQGSSVSESVHHFSEKDIEALTPLAGSSPWFFRPFQSGNCLDPAWNNL